MTVLHTTVHVFEDDEGNHFELSGRPVNDPVARIIGDKAAVAYLMPDDDCINPLDDCDGMGYIYSSHRDAGHEAHAAMQEALGLGADWEPYTDDFWETAESQALRQALTTINDRWGKGSTIFAVEEGSCGDGYVALQYPKRIKLVTLYYDTRWIGSQRYVLFRRKRCMIADDAEIGKTALQLWREARQKGEIGNKYAVPLDVYEHSGVSYSVSGEGMQCIFDTAKGGAVWIPDKTLTEEIESMPESDRQAFVIDRARSACQEYTSWCNGDCYGVVIDVYTFDGEQWISEDDGDSCWGFIGYSYAQEQLKEMLTDQVSGWTTEGDKADDTAIHPA